MDIPTENTSSTQQTPPQKMSSSAIVAIVVLTVITIIAVGSAVVFYLRYASQQYTPNPGEKDTLYSSADIPSSPVVEDDGEVYERGEDSFGVFTRKTKDSLKDYSGMFHEGEVEVNWYPHATLVNVEDTNTILQDISPTYALDNLRFSDMSLEWDGIYTDLLQFKLYEVGTISLPAVLQETTVYVFAYPLEGMGLGIADILVIRGNDAGSFVVLNDQASEPYLGGIVDMNAYVTGFIDVHLDLDAPTVLQSPHTPTVLTYQGSLAMDDNQFSDRSASNNRGGIVDMATGYIVSGYPDSAIAFRDSTYGPVYFIDNEYRIVLKDGSVQTYELLPSFLKKQDDAEEKTLYSLGYTADVVWNKDFSESYNTYVIGGELSVSGCGAGIVRQTNIVNNAQWFDENALRQVGKTKDGEGVFVLNDPALRSIYKDFFAYGGEGAILRQNPNMSFEEIEKIPQEKKFADFLANDPIIFWKDYKGRWRMYMKSEYQSLAECGKPVIYLYPEQSTDVRVEVSPNGGFTYTDPVYPEGGWVVNATPESQLYSYREDTVYPYLFWEGHADGFSFSDKGFVFSRDTLESDMRAVLTRAGLNNTETTDFLDFWVEKMKDKPYVFVTFANQQAFERAAPLRITPRPDSVLRLFMYFEPLDTPRDVEPLPLFGFERRGFSVVEWGGVLTK